jgi:hypothetical protein
LSKHSKDERRSGVDRRREDDPPPKGIERRKGVEPRKPEVTEIDMTPSEFGRLTAEVVPPSKPPSRR